jgi:hypothetical protein
MTDLSASAALTGSRSEVEYTLSGRTLCARTHAMHTHAMPPMPPSNHTQSITHTHAQAHARTHKHTHARTSTRTHAGGQLSHAPPTPRAAIGAAAVSAACAASPRQLPARHGRNRFNRQRPLGFAKLRRAALIINGYKWLLRRLQRF